MDLFDVGRACARRWYVTLPALLLTILLSAFSYMNVETRYFGTTVIGIAPAVAPGTATSGLPANGLMDSGGISLVSNLLALGLQDDQVRARVDEQGGVSDYSAAVWTVPGGQLPLVNVEVTGTSPTEVSKTLELVTQEASTTLQGIQGNAGVVDVSKAGTYRVRPPATPAARQPGRARTAVAIFAIGAALSVLLGVASDVLITRSRDRKRDERDAAEGFPTDTTDDATGSLVDSRNDSSSTNKPDLTAAGSPRSPDESVLVRSDTPSQ